MESKEFFCGSNEPIKFIIGKFKGTTVLPPKRNEVESGGLYYKPVVEHIKRTFK